MFVEMKSCDFGTSDVKKYKHVCSREGATLFHLLEKKLSIHVSELLPGDTSSLSPQCSSAFSFRLLS